MHYRILILILISSIAYPGAMPNLEKVCAYGQNGLNTLIDTTRDLFAKQGQPEIMRRQNTYAALKYTLEKLYNGATPELEHSTIETIGRLFEASLSQESTEARTQAVIKSIQAFIDAELTELSPKILMRRKLTTATKTIALSLGCAGILYGAYALRTQQRAIPNNWYAILQERGIKPLHNIFNYLTHMHDIKQAQRSYADHLRQHIQQNYANTWHYFKPETLRGLSGAELDARIESIVQDALKGKTGFMQQQIAAQGNKVLRNLATGQLVSDIFVLAHENYLNFLKMENTLKLIFTTITASLLSVFTYYSTQSAKSLYGSYRQRSHIALKVTAHELFMLYNELLETDEICDWHHGLARYYRETLEALAPGLAAHERALLLADCKTLGNPERSAREKMRLIKHWYSSFNLGAA